MYFKGCFLEIALRGQSLSKLEPSDVAGIPPVGDKIRSLPAGGGLRLKSVFLLVTGAAFFAGAAAVVIPEALTGANRFIFRFPAVPLALLLLLLLVQGPILQRLVLLPLSALREKIFRIAKEEEPAGDGIALSPVKELAELGEIFNAVSLRWRHERHLLEERARKRGEELARANDGRTADAVRYRRVKESLQRSEERFRAIFDGPSFGVTIVNPEGCILEINPAMKRIFGYSPDDPLGKRWEDLISPGDRERNEARFAEMMAGRCDHYEAEYRFLRKDGTGIRGSLHASLVRASWKQPAYAVMILTDVACRKRPPEDHPLPRGLFPPGECEDVPPAGRKILLMDDEEILRNVISQMLISLGYEATMAKDGREAVALHRQAVENGTPFDAVILDLTVPGGMGGLETAACLLRTAPLTKMVLSSGDNQDPAMTSFRTHGFLGAIRKPYRLKELDGLLRGILGGGAPSGGMTEVR
jgi:PAS domain S-box-containing protein